MELLCHFLASWASIWERFFFFFCKAAKAQHGVKKLCATPHSLCARRPMAMLGEPHNGCHDGPAHCTAIGGIRRSKFPYMCLHVSNRLRVRAAGLGSVHVLNQAPLKRNLFFRHISEAAYDTYRCSFWDPLCVNWAKSPSCGCFFLSFFSPNRFKVI